MPWVDPDEAFSLMDRDLRPKPQAQLKLQPKPVEPEPEPEPEPVAPLKPGRPRSKLSHNNPQLDYAAIAQQLVDIGIGILITNQELMPIINAPDTSSMSGKKQVLANYLDDMGYQLVYIKKKGIMINMKEKQEVLQERSETVEDAAEAQEDIRIFDYIEDRPVCSGPVEEKAIIHWDICVGLNDLYIRKNADYGDSFSKARKEIPNYTLGKLYDKFNRYKNLALGSDPKVKDESIQDTLTDLANYAILELIERKIDREQG